MVVKYIYIFIYITFLAVWKFYSNNNISFENNLFAVPFQLTEIDGETYRTLAHICTFKYTQRYMFGPRRTPNRELITE